MFASMIKSSLKYTAADVKKKKDKNTGRIRVTIHTINVFPYMNLILIAHSFSPEQTIMLCYMHKRLL